MSKLRLLHLEIAPVLVDDDGENLTVIRSEPMVITAANVPGFSEWWAREFAATQAQHEARTAPNGDGALQGSPKAT